MVSSYPPRDGGNDPLLGLDSTELVEKEQPEKSKWIAVPKKRAGGYAVRTRPGVFGEETEVSPGIWVSAAPELKLHPPVVKIETEAGDSVKFEPMPRAYAVKKPSWFQRLLDYILL